MKDYYKVLGIPKDANKDQIKKAYQEYLKKWKTEEDKFREASDAY